MEAEKNIAKEFLQQVKLCDIHIDNLLLDKARLEARATNVTASWGSEHVSGSGSLDKMGDTIAKIVDLEKEIDNAVDAFVNKKNEVRAVLENVQNPDHLSLLYKVYFQYEALEQVACEMNMSYRNACYIHGRALQTVEAVLKERVDVNER